MADVFKTRSNAFIEKIYGNALGQIRSENIINDIENLLKHNPDITSILDIGAGHAPVTLSILNSHSDMTAYLVDPSEQLLALAKENMKHFGIADERVKFFQGDLKEFLAQADNKRYDLVLCHAVVNWADDPHQFLQDLVKLCSPKTKVSLVFGSSTAKALRFAHQGNISDLLTTIESPGAAVQSLIDAEKVRPLDPSIVERWLEETGCTVSERSGIRIFADYVNPELLKDAQKLAQLKRAENIARKDGQYWKLGQLIHYVFHKQE